MNGDPSVVRGALGIVVAGALLGMIYNGMGLRSHPPRGIPWVAVREELATLSDSVSSEPPSEVPSETMSEPSAPETSAPPPGTSNPPAATGPDRAATRPAGAHGGVTAPPHPSDRSTAGTTSSPGPSAGTGAAPPATGGSTAPDPRRPVPLPFIPESDKPIQVQTAMVKRFFDAHAAVFIDARDPAEYEAGHIPGAVRMTGPDAGTDPDKVKALPIQGRPIICYCEGGACEASLDLAKVLIDQGYKKVLVYMGGFPEWSAASYPVEKGGAK